ncbi:hypothetical protein IMG5_001540 [Ichthyophthirius multifiliis]|uniref:Transmembrane protein n=1 Tax=Ichthyophthirius multifiliis TaxID=5932 RepID=G0QIZ3_ICHMU|nr:hypothetical protein IMG5_001540 [Ichthyophthirius multifiliis]EGR34813.1 hypothetical protein IMG5_001540 [Ichthyophthirius multifiliis]|eukprot:XP_004040117.1 hypothetical protein IMG5_001540 [Ichthyophthirius multifiliis]
MQQVNNAFPEIYNQDNRYKFIKTVRNFLQQNEEIELSTLLYRGYICQLAKLYVKEFGAFYFSQKLLNKNNHFDIKADPVKHSFYNFYYSFAIGSFVEIFAFPLEKAKTIMIMDSDPDYEKQKYRSPITPFIQQAENNKYGQFTGFGISMLGAAIYRGIQIGLYETLMNLGLKDYGWYLQLPTSVLATIIGQKVAYPFDTLRRKLFLQGTDFEVEKIFNDWMGMMENKNNIYN